MLKKFFILGLLGVVMLGETTNINTKNYIISKNARIIKEENLIKLDEKEEIGGIKFSLKKNIDRKSYPIKGSFFIIKLVLYFFKFRFFSTT